MEWITANLKTLRDAVGVRGLAISTTVAGAGAFARYLDGAGMTWVFQVLQPFLVPALVVAALLFYWTLNYATEKRLAAQPSMSIEFGQDGPFVYDRRVEVPDLPGGFETFRCYRVRVTNDGGQMLRACKVQVQRITADDGKEQVGIPFSLRHDRTGEGIFTLSCGEQAMISVLAVPINGPRSVGPSKLGVVGEEWPYFSARGTAISHKPATIVLQALSEGKPRRERYRFDLNAQGHFEMHSVPTERPRWWSKA